MATAIPGVTESASSIGPVPDFSPKPDDGKSALQRLREQATAEVEAKKTRARGPDGQFLPEGAPAGEAAKSSPVPGVMQDMMGEQVSGEAPPEPAEQTEPKPKWTFAGEEFPDQTAAENKYKTVRGMIKASEARTRQALELVQQYESEIQRLRQSPQPEQPTDQPQEQAQRFVESLGQDGWNTYESMRSERGEAFANAWLMDKVEDHVRSMVTLTADQLRQELSERYPFLEEQNSHLETIHNVASLFQEFQGMPNDAEDGPRYPALHERDPQKLQENVRKLGGIWKRFVERADPQTIRDPYWMDVAYAEFERANGNPGSGGGGPDNLDRLQRAAQERSSNAVSGNGAPMRERPRDAKSDIARLFTTTPQRKSWGFDPDR